jgi:hypothetical protein
VSAADPETPNAVRVNRVPSQSAVSAPGWVRVSWTDAEGAPAAGVVLEVAVN